ncbi:unnamed protein product, partial [Oppiella nova]
MNSMITSTDHHIIGNYNHTGSPPSNNIHVLRQILLNWNSSEQYPGIPMDILEKLLNGTNVTLEAPTLQSPFFEYMDTIALKVFFYGLYILIFFLGIAGNALVCYVVMRNSSMHTVTNMFITNLAISDIFLCVFAVPFTPLYLLTYKEWVFGTFLCHLVPYAQGMCPLIALLSSACLPSPSPPYICSHIRSGSSAHFSVIWFLMLREWVFGTFLCHLVPYAQGVSVYISAFTLMSIAIDRYFVIIYPFRARMEMRICFIIIITIWLSACLLTLPYGILMGVQEYPEVPITYCEEEWTHD